MAKAYETQTEYHNEIGRLINALKDLRRAGAKSGKTKQEVRNSQEYRALVKESLDLDKLNRKHMVWAF